MNYWLLLAIIFALLAICVLVFFSGYTKLKEYKDKITKAENIIDENLTKKLELIILLNSSIKKVTGKKDYLKDYINIKDLIITNIEKDTKLTEAEKLINDLTRDYTEINNDKDFKKNYKELRETDEVLVSAKNLFNQNATEINQLIKNFPYNIIAKLIKMRIRSLYPNNKTDDNENF